MTCVKLPALPLIRDLFFGSLSADVPALDDWLGAAKIWIDLMAVQSPEGLEVVPGSSTYKTDGNWKLQAENSVDGYHVSTVHRVFAHTIAARKAKANIPASERQSPAASRAVFPLLLTTWVTGTWLFGPSTRRLKPGQYGRQGAAKKRAST